MLSKQPFERRILIAFVLMTTLVSGVFSLSIVAVVHFIEDHLLTLELGHELQGIIEEDLKLGRVPRLDPSTHFYASNIPEFLPPPDFSGLRKGFSEVVLGADAYYAYTEEVDGNIYTLVQGQHGFEAREHVLFNVVLAGFLLTVVGAWGLGLILARKIMAPVSRLAMQVRHRDQLLALAPALGPQYPDDEVGQLASAFDSTLGQVRQALERERLFTSDVSHELRTPLMVIATTCELLEEGELGAKEKEQLARIIRASEEMHDLVRTFLQLARDSSDEASSVSARSLESVAEEQIAHWGASFRLKGLELIYSKEGLDTGVYNTTLLSVVVSNLLRNALHYTDNGFVRLVIETGGLRVEDSGSGIPIDQQERIFQPFVRGVGARGEGLGLGLSLVKRICVKQGWLISVMTINGGGACFRVQLSGKTLPPSVG
ncbi:HAMP domain-containing sensor histidine kinase [Ectopseudomonas mendocina]|uniref:histidine kinase n=1 Tax=Ectopseudomonas mendocina TaxID=300 RepID=A0ABZ2RMJ7_ECTME